MTSEASASSHHSMHKTASHSTAAEHGYPHGHLGHLSEHEEEAFGNFKRHLEENGLYKAGPPPSHQDHTLLRFLRARRWVVEDAYKQFKETEDWRAANHLDVLYDTIDVEAYEQGRRLYPQWTGRRDRRGIPVYVFEIRHLDSRTIATYEKSSDKPISRAPQDGTTPPKMMRLFALYENLTRFAQPLATQLVDDREFPDTPVTMSTNIVDVSGVSLRMFWNLKGHMQAASQLATAHYPETLDRIFIVGAPLFFSTVWGWIKRWFDPITVSKIFILSPHEVKHVIESFIDPANFPRTYGGELDWSWGSQPTLDPAVDRAVEWCNGYSSFPMGPMYWRPCEEDPARLECWGVGSEDGKDRRVRICTIKKATNVAGQQDPKAEAPAAVEGVPAEEAAAVVVANGKAADPAPAAAAAEGADFLPLTFTPGEAAPAAAPEPAAAPATAESAGGAIEALTLTEAVAPAATKADADAAVVEKVEPSAAAAPATATVN